MIPFPNTEEIDDHNTAQILSIHVCGDECIHLMMEDKLGNLLGEMMFDPEEALSVAKRIEQAADCALGIA